MFTEDGEITYGATQSVLHAWGPSSSVLRAVILAFLTTLLSYQATATVIDLAFGTKKFGFAKVHDIQLLLLIRRQSPYAVARSLFKKLPFSRLPNADSRDPPGKLRVGVVVKLVLLLFVAPVVNIAAIFLTLEFDTTLTFGQLDFGGLALGVDVNATRRGYATVSQACVRAPVSVGRAEIALAEFPICDTISPPQSSPGSISYVRISSTAENVLHVGIGAPFLRLNFFSAAHLVGNDAQVDFGERYNFRVAVAVTNETLEVIATETIDRMRVFCGREPDEVFENKERPRIQNIITAFSNWQVPCDVEDTIEGREFYDNILQDIRKKIVFVESDRFRVVDNEESPGSDTLPDFVTPDGENFVRRRNTYADIFIMFIFVVAMVFVRLFIRCLTRNDLPRGVGLIIRDELGIPCCDSMLPSSDVVAKYSGLAHLSVRHGDDGIDDY